MNRHTHSWSILAKLPNHLDQVRNDIKTNSIEIKKFLDRKYRRNTKPTGIGGWGGGGLFHKIRIDI